MAGLYVGRVDVCRFCGWHEAWSTEFASGLAALWHAWDAHRDEFVGQARRLGVLDTMEGQPRPEEYGTRGRIVATMDADGAPGT